jgi:hypothetical protein
LCGAQLKKAQGQLYLYLYLSTYHLANQLGENKGDGGGISDYYYDDCGVSAYCHNN